MRRLGPTLLAVACLMGAAACQPPAPPPSVVTLDHAVGVRYAPTPEELAQYEAWLGRPVDTALFYFDGETADEVLQHASWLLNKHRTADYDTLVYSMPLVLAGQSLDKTANGGNDKLWKAVARLMVANGRGDDIVRPGWELNGKWFAWSALEQPNKYAKAFRRVVTAMRSVPGAEHLRFEWNVARGGEVVPEAAYPGDEYVDVIGMDIYDRTYEARLADPAVRWDHYQTDLPGLNWLADFAAAHGKPIGFSEWALSDRHLAGVDPDNPLFIEQMHAWIEAHNVAYAIYFEDDTPDLNHMLTRHFPNASARYRELFGTADP